MNADHLVVFDTKKREVVANLAGFPGVHGVSGGSGVGQSVCVRDRRTQSCRRRCEDAQDHRQDRADQLPGRYRLRSRPQAVFVSDEHGDADAVIDATTNSLITTISLGGGAGNTVYDSGSGHILVAVHEKNELVAIDPASAKITGRYPMTGIESPHGIALDVDARMAFVAGEENHKVALVDLTNMKVLATYPVWERSRCPRLRSGP